MITVKEATDRYERIVGPLRKNWHNSEQWDPNGPKFYALFVQAVKIEKPILDEVIAFWKATPTQQLCEVARKLSAEAGGKE